MKTDSLLVDGKIPANTVCPFKANCAISKGGTCHHTGVDHNNPFSCGAARGFDILNQIPSNPIQVQS